MADNKQTDAPDKTGQAVTGGDKAAPDTPAKVTAPEKSPDQQAPPAGGKTDKAAPAGPDDKIPGKGKIVDVEFPSGKANPGSDKQAPPASADRLCVPCSGETILHGRVEFTQNWGSTETAPKRLIKFMQK
ncbi:MAG: hypothetical protein LIO58_02500 [Oscillospiraceae bacterium]|nr:hypothetical protein [Oscillospiraceae bacterium]